MILTNNQETLGGLAVKGFFAISGYFIFISLKSSKTITNYLWKRVLRLIPALMVLMGFSVLIFINVYEGQNLWAEPTFITYIPNCLSLYNVQFRVNGIFEENPFKGAVNGSLWSLCYEFTMYIALILMFFIKNKKYPLYLLIFAFIALFSLHNFRPGFLNKYFFSYIHLSSEKMYNLATFFIAGSIFTYFDISRFNTLAMRLVLLLLIILSFYFNIYQFASPFLLPLFLLMVGSLSTPNICTIGKKIGDISYGVYIYGFIIQQTLMYYFQLNSLSLMFLSIPIAYGFAFLSWHFVEEKMMKFKNFIK